MSMENTRNLHWHDGEVTRADRNALLRQRGATLWFTGLSGSGKSTVAVALEKELYRRGHLAYRLDGDNIRLGINSNLGFSAADRTENIRRIGEIAKLFVDAGVIALSSFISPYRSDREAVRALHAAAGMDFIEVYVECPLNEAERRDPKGLYRKARAGQIRNFTGIDDPYEVPRSPELVLNTHEMALDAEVAAVVELLESRGIIPLADSSRTRASVVGDAGIERFNLAAGGNSK